MKPRILLLFVLLLPQSVAAQRIDPYPKSVFRPDIRSDIIPMATNRSCGPWAIACLMNSAGYRLNDERLAELLELDPEKQKQGTSPLHMRQYLSRFFDVRRVTSTTLKQLYQHLDSAGPALLAVEVHNTPHWVLVTGYSVNSDGEFHWKIIDNGSAEGLVSTKRLKRIWDAYTHRPNFALFLSPHKEHGEPQFRTELRLPSFDGISPDEIDSSIEMILAALDRAAGHAARADARIALANLNTEPVGKTYDDCERILRPHFAVQKLTHGQPADLVKRLHAGYPVLLSRTTAGKFHWSLLTGYTVDHLGRYESWHVLDRYTPSARVSHRDFLRSWHTEYQGHQFWPALILADKEES